MLRRERAYSAYGEVAVLGPDDGNTLRYTGREDDGIGLYFYRARYYNPILKRFISEDSIGMAARANFYAYISGNPIRLSDPLGLVDVDAPIKPPPPPPTDDGGGRGGGGGGDSW